MYPVFHEVPAANVGPLMEPPASRLERVIESIVSIVDAESLALRNNQPFDLSTMNMRKARLLMDFSAAAKSVDLHQMPPRIHEGLRRLRAALAINLSQYQAHASAVREIVQMMLEVAQAQHNDGTYSAGQLR